MASSIEPSWSTRLRESGFTDEHIGRLRARDFPDLLELVALRYDEFGRNLTYHKDVEGNGMIGDIDPMQTAISPEDFLRMTEARDDYEGIKDFINDCDDLFQEGFSKEQILRLASRSKNIFQVVIEKFPGLLEDGFDRDQIVNRISLLDRETIEAVAMCGKVLLDSGMDRNTILTIAAEEGGHYNLMWE